MYINSQNTLAKRLQHRLALFEQGGDFVGFEPEQNALQNPHQTPNRHRTHKNTEQNGPDGIEPPASDLLFNLIEGDSDDHHANLLVLRVVDGRKNAQRFGERAPVNRYVLFAFQRGR